MLKINSVKLITIFLIQGLFVPSGFCQHGPHVYIAHKKTAMTVLSPQININTVLLQSGFNPKHRDLQEKNLKLAEHNKFSIPSEYYADWVSVAIRRLTHGRAVWGYLDELLGEYHAGFIEELRRSIKEKKGTPQDWARLFEALLTEIKQEINSRNIAEESLRENLELINTAINFLHGRNQNQVIDLDELLLKVYKNIPITIDPDIRGDLIGKISGNRSDLLSAFVNFLNNFIAISHQLYSDKKISKPEYTDMQVKGKGFLIKKKIENGFAVIEFQDNLGGIPEEYLIPGKYKFNGKQYPKIFDYGFSRRKGGTGIGLAETLFVIMMHGGDLDIISESGKGTTFIIKLPLNSSVRKKTLFDGQSDVFFKSIDQQQQSFTYTQSILQSI